MKIVVCGYMVRLPLTGNMLAYFHYVFGLHRLGHEVTYIEESGWPWSSYDPVGLTWEKYPTTGLRMVRELLAAYDVHIPVIYVDRGIRQADRNLRAQLKQLLEDADLLLNIGGVCWLPEFTLCSRRVLIDMDPVFTQMGKFGAKLSNDYHVRFSYGANIGKLGCTIPTEGIEWLPTVPPVAPELWRGGPAPEHAPFTTIANWNSFRGITYNGERYGQKGQELLRLVTLPRRTSQSLELALSGAPDGALKRLRAAGWSVRNGGAEVSTDVPTYQAYIHNSRGELSAAKHAYVKTRSGWFSDRSVCYLAAGRPVILQDTGFQDWLDVDRGVLSFSSVQEAAERIEEVNANYKAHCQAAREIAEHTFGYKVVLPRLIQTALDTKDQGTSNVKHEP